MSQNDLGSWLLQQIAEDERRAKAPPLASSWHRGDGSSEYFATHVVYPLDGDDLEDERKREALGIVTQHDEAAIHIDAWDPDRVLADCDAKRRIVEWHREETLPDGVPTRTGLCDICMNWSWPCDTLRLLALPYADRPGYMQEWRPSQTGTG